MDFTFVNALLKTAQAINNSDTFLVGNLLSKTAQLAEIHPYDITTLGMLDVFEKKLDKQPVISRSELRNLYQTLYTNNNKFAQAFQEELGFAPEVEKQLPEEKPDLDVFAETDKVLVKNLESVLNKENKLFSYSDKIANQTEEFVAFNLNKIEAPPKTVEVIAGNANLLIARACYESPKGEVSALIPVDVINNMPVMAGCFVGENGLEKLSKDTLINHLKTTAGKSLKVNAEQVLNYISNYGNINEVELAVQKMKTASLNNNFTLDHLGLVYSNPEELFKSASEIEMPQYELPEELSGFAKQLSTTAGEAELIFGKQNVESARNVLSKQLKSLGFNCQLGIANLTKDHVVFAAKLDHAKAVNIPIKIANNQVFLPTIAIANGEIAEFSKEGLSSLIENNTDNKALMYASSHAELTSQEVLISLAQALKEENLLKAEDALHALAFLDQESFNIGNEMYMSALAGDFKKAASLNHDEHSKCSAPITDKNSKYLVCSHTNLPIHKVYQDKFGHCRPMHRKGNEDGEKSPQFSTYKIFWE